MDHDSIIQFNVILKRQVKMKGIQYLTVLICFINFKFSFGNSRVSQLAVNTAVYDYCGMTFTGTISVKVKSNSRKKLYNYNF